MALLDKQAMFADKYHDYFYCPALPNIYPFNMTNFLQIYCHINCFEIEKKSVPALIGTKISRTQPQSVQLLA